MWLAIGLLGALAFSLVASVALLAGDEEPGLRNLRQIRERPGQQLALQWRARTARATLARFEGAFQVDGALARGFEGGPMDASRRLAQGAAEGR